MLLFLKGFNSSCMLSNLRKQEYSLGLLHSTEDFLVLKIIAYVTLLESLKFTASNFHQP